jgi:hypothetical protein
MFDRTFMVKRADVEDPLDRTYYVDSTSVFMRGKKMANVLEGKILTKDIRETKSLKESKPFIKLDKNGPLKVSNNSDKKSHKEQQTQHQNNPSWKSKKHEYIEM